MNAPLVRATIGDGSSYIAGDLATWLKDQRMDHVRGTPNHPQVRHGPPSVRGPWRTGKIERWHQTLKNGRRANAPLARLAILRTLRETHDLPGGLEAAIGKFVDHYNHHRIHESLGNVTPADAYFGRAPAILKERRRIKKETIRKRRLLNQISAE